MRVISLVSLLAVVVFLAVYLRSTNDDQIVKYGRLNSMVPPSKINASTITAFLRSIEVFPAENVTISPQDRQALLSILLQVGAIMELPGQSDILLPRDLDIWRIYEANFSNEGLAQSFIIVDGKEMISLKKLNKSVKKIYLDSFGNGV